MRRTASGCAAAARMSVKTSSEKPRARGGACACLPLAEPVAELAVRQGLSVPGLVVTRGEPAETVAAAPLFRRQHEKLHRMHQLTFIAVRLRHIFREFRPYNGFKLAPPKLPPLPPRADNDDHDIKNVQDDE